MSFVIKNFQFDHLRKKTSNPFEMFLIR